MESVRLKACAKINLTLFVTGREGEYHTLDSLVGSVNLYDTIAVKKRRDKQISVTMHGMGSESIPFENNNAVKAAKLFVEKFGTGGADITVRKNIPMGAGLGGSSADAAGVLNGLAKLYKTDDTESLKLIADRTGSDTRYMLSGGFARLSGRGNAVKVVKSKLKLHILLLVPDDSVSTAKCYGAFDGLGEFGGNSDAAERAAVENDLKGLAGEISNSLTQAAASLSDGIKKCIDELNELAPLAVNMTGSGSGVYALFENKKACISARKSYKGSAKTFILEVK